MTGGRLAAWDLNKDEPTWRAESSDESADQVAISGDGSLVAGCARFGQRIRLWDARTGAAGRVMITDEQPA